MHSYNKGETTMNMTLTQAMQILGVAEGQQLSDEVAEAIRTVLAEMKQRAEIVRCDGCCRKITLRGQIYCTKFNDSPVYETDFCSYGERK